MRFPLRDDPRAIDGTHCSQTLRFTPQERSHFHVERRPIVVRQGTLHECNLPPSPSSSDPSLLPLRKEPLNCQLLRNYHSYSSSLEREAVTLYPNGGWTLPDRRVIRRTHQASCQSYCGIQGPCRGFMFNTSHRMGRLHTGTVVSSQNTFIYWV